MEFLNAKQIKNITLISSESCNLNCSYCEIAKSSALFHNKIEAKKVKDSLFDGSYLSNIQKVLSKLDIDCNQILGFDLWGQEPTLTLDGINFMLPSFFTTFPHLEKAMFSTNGVQYPERIIEFIKTIESICKEQKKNKKFEIRIQFSFDGYENTKKNRGIEPEVILNNIKFIINELNKEQFNYIRIKFVFNNVIAKEEIKKLNSEEIVKKYWTDLFYITKEFIELNKNKNVEISKYFTAGLETPINASADEGRMFYKFLLLSEKIYNDSNKDEKYAGYLRVLTRMAHSFDVIYVLQFENSEKFIEHLINYDYDPIFINQISRSIFCNPNMSGLKIKYDGTLLHCHNVIHNMKKEDFINKTNWKYDNLKNLINYNYYPNPLNDSKDKLENYFYKMRIIQSSSYAYTYSLIVQLMTYLRDFNQISDIYKDNKILLKHALMIMKITSCLNNGFQLLGTGAGSWIGIIRYYCNGALLLAEREEENIKKFNINRRFKNDK